MKRTRRLLIITLIVAALAVLVVVMQGLTKTRREPGAFETIQDYAREAKAAHEREMESKREALGRPAP